MRLRLLVVYVLVAACTAGAAPDSPEATSIATHSAAAATSESLAGVTATRAESEADAVTLVPTGAVPPIDDVDTAAPPSSDEPTMERCPPPLAPVEIHMTNAGTALVGNEWEVSISPPSASTLVARIAVGAGARVTRLRFEVAPDQEPWPGSAVWTDEVSRALEEGAHRYELNWTGADAQGQVVPPGRYHLFATGNWTGPGDRCSERHDSTFGLGLGYLVVHP